MIHLHRQSETSFWRQPRHVSARRPLAWRQGCRSFAVPNQSIRAHDVVTRSFGSTARQVQLHCASIHPTMARHPMGAPCPNGDKFPMPRLVLRVTIENSPPDRECVAPRLGQSVAGPPSFGAERSCARSAARPHSCPPQVVTRRRSSPSRLLADTFIPWPYAAQSWRLAGQRRSRQLPSRSLCSQSLLRGLTVRSRTRTPG
jgi:hypothetical protein